jgi:hypothetical protein
MKALFTGSQVYGNPGPKSDIDIVVLVTEDELAIIARVADSDSRNLSKWTELEGADYFITQSSVVAERGKMSPLTASLRFGKLNLLCVTNEEAFQVWEEGTAELSERAPVTRETAVATFQRLQKAAGLA